MSTNNIKNIGIEEKERRWTILETSQEHTKLNMGEKESLAYWNTIGDSTREPGFKEALLAYLLDHEVSVEFSPNQSLETIEMRAARIRAMPDATQWLISCIENNGLSGAIHHHSSLEYRTFSKKMMFEAYKNWSNETKYFQLNEHEFFKWIKEEIGLEEVRGYYLYSMDGEQDNFVPDVRSIKFEKLDAIKLKIEGKHGMVFNIREDIGYSSPNQNKKRTEYIKPKPKGTNNFYAKDNPEVTGQHGAVGDNFNVVIDRPSDDELMTAMERAENKFDDDIPF